MSYGFGGFDSFDFMFGVFPIFFFIIFAGILGTIIYTAVKSMQQHARDDASPTLTVQARITSKRIDVSHHSSINNDTAHTHHSHTYYYVTFQVESGDRMEFAVDGKEYGLMAEGDDGRLTFQGSRYLGFNRLKGN